MSIRRACTFVLAACCTFHVGNHAAAQNRPQWAYGSPPATAAAPAGAPAQPPPPDTTVRRVEGSDLTFTRAQISDAFGPADWFPGDHPQMPEIVAKGKKPDVRACALCHYPNGKGRAENAGVSGLPVSYFIQQLQDFANGSRKSADPKKNNTNIMIGIAKAMTPEEMKASAEYFGSMKWTPWIRVVESDRAPKTRLQGGLFLALPGNETEPIGDRIVEVPEDTEAAEILRNPRSGFVAYVPPGSVKKGEALVTTGGGKTTTCGLCHGADLKGLGPVPGLAGRSPSYVVRQMVDMQQGARNGEWTQLMKPVVSKLSDIDMLNLAAYLASLKP